MAVLSILSLAAGAQQPQAPGPDRLRDISAGWETPRRALIGPHWNLYNPRVVRVPDPAYPYRMWFFGWPTADNNPVAGRPIGDAIYHARSRDMQTWEVYAGGQPDGAPRWAPSDAPERFAPVVSALDPGFQDAIAGDPSVVYRRGRYYMAFSSVWFEPHADTTPQHLYVIACIMGAVSEDGVHWQRTRKPIAIWDREYTCRMDAAGGVFVRPEGYAGSYHRPSLLWDGGRWRLWFDYLKPGTFASMGLAENRGDFMDADAWRVLRAGDAPVLADWVNPSVVKVGRTYYSFSDSAGYPPAYGGDGRLLTVADSSDGVRWRVLGHLRPEGLASSHVPEAFVDGGWLYVLYAWKPPTETGKPWDYRYKEIRCMRIRLGSLKQLEPTRAATPRSRTAPGTPRREPA